MTTTTQKFLKRATILGIMSASLAGCNALTRISEVGRAPDLAPIENPTHRQDYKPVSMPMPQPEQPTRHANTLWRAGSTEFLGDQRAKRVGDILTINIDINDQADVQNDTTRTRANSESMNAPFMAGYQNLIARFLPNEVSPDPANLWSTNSGVSNAGTGQISREDDIAITVAAVVTQVLPNGNLVIEGRQEVRVNFEVREIVVAGIIRPEDISATNTIAHTQIAEARIAYGGRGQITDVQQPRYGSQVMDILLPF